MQTSTFFDAVRTVKFLGASDPSGPSDPSIWLEDKNDGQNPLLVPLWPADFPNHLAAYLTESGEVGVALSRDAMLRACRSLLRREPCLWFCNIPLAEFLAVTDADPSLFS
jgi:hypothetical protein